MPTGVYDRSKSKARKKTKPPLPKEQPVTSVTDTYDTPADEDLDLTTEVITLVGSVTPHLNYAQYFDAFEVLEAIERTYGEHGVEVPDGLVLVVPIPDTSIVAEGVYDGTSGVWTLAPRLR